MAFPTTFANLTNATGQELDDNFTAAGVLGTLPCTITGTNTLALTLASNTPTLTGYSNYIRFGGIASADNSGAATAQVGSLGALSIYKDTSSGPVPLTGAEIQEDTYIELIYDSALDSGSGGFHLSSSTVNSGGTVTSVASGTGLTGGPITSTGTLALAAIATARIMANISGGSLAPAANTLTAILDNILGTTQGTLLYRNATVWTTLAVGSSGQPLTTRGASANLAYGFTQTLGISAAGTVQGDATALTAVFNEVTTTPAATGVRLQNIQGIFQVVANRGANTLNVWPFSGASINAGGADAAVTQATTVFGIYWVVSNTQIYRIL